MSEETKGSVLASRKEAYTEGQVASSVYDGS